MNRSVAFPRVARRISGRRPRRGVPRIALAVIGAGALLTATSRAAEAQSPSGSGARWELTVPTGKLVPTGVQRDALQRGGLTAIQLSYVPRPALAFTATVGWARSRDVAALDEPKLDVFMYDLGAELRAPRLLGGGAVTVSPFAGVGAGARSYNYRSLHVDATHNPAAYGSVGAELGIRRVRLRLEARDYVTGFKPLVGAGPARTRNDVVLMAGLRFAR